MTDTVVTDPQPAAPVRRGRRAWIISAVAAVVLVAAGVPAGVWFVHWRSSLHVLVSYPLYGAGQSVGIGHSLYFGGQATTVRELDQQDHQDRSAVLDINIESIRSVVRENTADADITVERCTLRQATGGAIGLDEDGTSDFCSALTPFRSGRVRLAEKADASDLVIKVTPHRAGRVRIAGVDVRYSYGLRHGTQHSGGDVETTTKA